MKTLILILTSALLLGWMVGLSVSEVTGGVVAAILAGLIGLIGGTIGREPKGSESNQKKWSQPEVRNLAAVCVLTIGISVGATIGVWARTHQWLEPDENDLISNWVERGIPREIAVKAAFEKSFSSQSGSTTGSGSAGRGVLFSQETISTQEIEAIRRVPDDQLYRQLMRSQNEKLRALGEKYKDDSTALKLIITELLSK